MGHAVGLGFKAQMDLGTLVPYKGHKCQITNFILNSKREFLKFRIFFFLHLQKRNYSYCLSIKFIIFICLKNRKYIFKL